MNSTSDNGDNFNTSIRYQPQPFEVQLGVAVIVIASISIIPNLIIIIGTHYKTTLRKSMYYFMANLAGCDIILAVSLLTNVLIPISVRKAGKPLPAQDTICKIFAIYFGYWSYNASVQTLCVISYERYNAISRPAKRLKRKVAKILCGVTWCVSCGVSAPFLFTGTSVGYRCVPFATYTTWVFGVNLTLAILQFIVPMIVMITTYSLILHQLRQKDIHPRVECAKNKRLKKKTVYMVLLTTLIFFCCALPWTLSMFIEAFSGKLSYQILRSSTNSGIHNIIRLSRILLPLITLYNPIIYCIFNPKIRELFFPCYYRCRKNVIQVHSTPTLPNKCNETTSTFVLPFSQTFRSEIRQFRSTLTELRYFKSTTTTVSIR